MKIQVQLTQDELEVIDIALVLFLDVEEPSMTQKSYAVTGRAKVREAESVSMLAEVIK